MTRQEKESIIQTGASVDVDIAKISGCKHSHSMDWCEKYCPKYYGCYTIAYANDILKEQEEIGG